MGLYMFPKQQGIRAESDGVENLYEYLTNEIIQNIKVGPLQSLTEKFSKRISAAGISEIHDSAKKKCHCKLSAKFQDDL